MKTHLRNLSLLLLLVMILGMDQSLSQCPYPIDQEQTQSNIGVYGSYQWQSFKAGSTNRLGSIDVYSNAAYAFNDSILFYVFRETGNTGTPVYSYTYYFDTIPSGWISFEVPWANNITLKNDSIYTFLLHTTSDLYLAGNAGNVYADGFYANDVLGHLSNWDLKFRTCWGDKVTIVHTLMGETEYCENSPYANLWMNNTETGIEYKLYRDGVYVQSRSGNGSQKNFSSQSTIGHYTVIAQNPTTTCTYDMAGSVDITEVLRPVCEAGPNDTLCGYQYMVTGASAANYSSIQWTTSGTGVFLNNGTLTPTYVTTDNDLMERNIDLILTAYPNAPCLNEVRDTIKLTVLEKTNAGLDETICKGTDFLLKGSFYGDVPMHDTFCISNCLMPQHCTSSSINPWYLYVYSLKIDNEYAIQYTSLPTSLVDFTGSLAAEVVRDSTFNLKISVENYYNINKNMTTFIDWNRDGDFDDDNEEYGANQFSNIYGSYVKDIVVPPGAVLGNSLMRIIVTADSAINECGIYYIGQTIDLRINIKAKTPDYPISFEWTGPNNFYSTEMRPTLPNVSIYEAGRYYLEMSNVFGCVQHDSMELTILPKDTITRDHEICWGDTTTLTITGEATEMQFYSFEWSNGSTNDTIEVWPTSTTTYYCTVTGPICTTVDSVQVTVHPLPVVDLGGDATLCRWTTIEIDSSFVSYDWCNGAMNSFWFNIDTPGTYHVVVVDTNSCINSSDTVDWDITETTTSFSGLVADYLTNASPATLVGNPLGGNFSGSGISGNTFTPVNAGLGVHEIIYAFTDATPCVNRDTQYVQVYANDLELTEVLFPQTGLLTSNEIVTIKVANRGLNAVDQMLLSFKAVDANGTSVFDISEAVNHNISAGDTLTYIFSQTVDMSGEEEYYCTASVNSPGDQIPGNDSLDVLITNYYGSYCQKPYSYTFQSPSLATINHSIDSANWYRFTLDSAYINFTLSFAPNTSWANIDVDVWEDCLMNTEIVPDNSTFLPTSITISFDTIWPGEYIVRVSGSGDYSLDVSGYKGVYGCTNPNSPTYNPLADFDDGDCDPMNYGCFPQNNNTIYILNDTTWNTETIEICTDIYIVDGVTVTIAPGTQLVCYMPVDIIVEGTLLAIGQPGDSIIFGEPNGLPGANIIFNNISGTMNDNDSSKLELCVFEDSDYENGPITVESFSNLAIRNCRFVKNQISNYSNSSHGLIYCAGESNIKIQQNIFSLNLVQYNHQDGTGIISCMASSPTITGNIFSANSSQNVRAGIITCAYGAAPLIKRNSITGNFILGTYEAAAILCLTNANPVYEDNLIMQNAAECQTHSAAIICDGADGLFKNNTISHNTGETGGAFYLIESDAQIIENLIQFNFSRANGGAISVFHMSNIDVYNNFIHGNRAFFGYYGNDSGMGGGLYVHSGAAHLFNNVLCFNDGFHGGAIAATDVGTVYAINNTVSNNYSYRGGAIYASAGAYVNLTNSLIYYNHAQIGGEIYDLSNIGGPSGINLTYCNLEGGQAGISSIGSNSHNGTYVNCIDVPPYYVDALHYNYELQFASACINAGTPDTIGLGIPPLDVTGKQRVLNDTIDIGAFETTRIGTCGAIYADTTWSADTICVACDIVVQDSATLTIDPGTVVEFMGPYKIDVRGNLMAEGLPNDSIIFTISDTTGFHNYNSKSGGWMGIRFDNGPLGALGEMSDNDSSLIDYCKLNYAKVISNYIEGFAHLEDAISVYSGSQINTLSFPYITNIDTAFDKGGAIYVNNLSRLKISNSELAYNKAYLGGSVYCENNASPEIVNTKIYNNEAKSAGGGLFLTGSAPEIKNSLIVNNSAIDYNGGGIASFFSMPKLTNVTVCNNSDSLLSQGIVFMGAPPIIKNSILWGDANSPDTLFSVVLTDTIPIISNSNIQGYAGGLGNINALPMFVAPTTGSGANYEATTANYSIDPASPCVNMGTSDTSGLSLPLTDLGDNARIQNGNIDIGAYEVHRILGCMDPAGLNYNPQANVDDGNCEYSGEDCSQAINYGTVNDPAITGVIVPYHDKWALFSIDADYKSVTISLCASNFDSELELYEDCASSSYFAYNDDGCMGAQSKITLDTLEQGTYYVRFKGKGMASGSYHLEITGTKILNTTLSATHVSCWGYSDGSIDMTISGGASPFTIEWSNGMTLEDISNLKAGEYSVTVTDNENSSFINMLLLTQPDAPTRDYDIWHVVCHGDSTGEIDLTVNGDYPPFTYEWNDGKITRNRANLFAGTYYVTITDDETCEVYDTVVVNQNDLITTTIEIEHISCHGESDGEISQTVEGGITPYTYEWSFVFDSTFSKSNKDLIELAYGTYDLTITDDSACQVIDQAVVYEPDELEATIAGTNVSIAGASDGIADLTPSGGVAPYSYEWSNDSITEDIDQLPEGTYTVTVSDDHGCTVSASVYIGEPDVNITQSIILPQAWSMFSTYIIPTQADIANVMTDIVSNVIIAKDGEGKVYYPAYGTNQIGNLTIGKGYQVKMEVSDVLEITGPSAIPENTHISVAQGWGIIGYLRHPSGAIAEMLSTIVNEIIIVKNGDGEIYWPQFGVDLIGTMNPGEGYKLKMESQETLTYPSNNYNSAKATGQTPISQHFFDIKSTENNMTLGIPANAWTEEPEPGDEIGVFSEMGYLVGNAVYTGGNTALSLWGDDSYTFAIDGLIPGESFTVKLWRQANNSEETLVIEKWDQGSALYKDNQIAIIGKLSRFNLQGSTIDLLQNTPNPFKDETTIEFELTEADEVELCVYDVFGQLLEVLERKHFDKGKHQVLFNAKNYSSGVYIYKLKTKDKTMAKSMNIVKR